MMLPAAERPPVILKIFFNDINKRENEHNYKSAQSKQY
jgi:hypothetical protein